MDPHLGSDFIAISGIPLMANFFFHYLYDVWTGPFIFVWEPLFQSKSYLSDSIAWCIPPSKYQAFSTWNTLRTHPWIAWHKAIWFPKLIHTHIYIHKHTYLINYYRETISC